MKLVLGLPPFMPVALIRKHPDWRIHPDESGRILKLAPDEKDLGTRSGCNLGPWGDYLIDLCAELAADFDLDGFSFDGNYHPPICYCPACKRAYHADAKRDLPRRVNLADVSQSTWSMPAVCLPGLSVTRLTASPVPLHEWVSNRCTACTLPQRPACVALTIARFRSAACTSSRRAARWIGGPALIPREVCCPGGERPPCRHQRGRVP